MRWGLPVLGRVRSAQLSLRLPDTSFPSFSAPCPNPQIIANHHMQSISFASGGDPVSWGTEQRWWEKSKGLVGKTGSRDGHARMEAPSGKHWD